MVTNLFAKPRINWTLIGIFYFLNLLDVISTKLVLEMGGSELNPLVNILLDTYGIQALYIAKLIVLTPLTAVLYWKRASVPNMPNGILIAVTVIFFLTIINNLVAIGHLL